MTIADEMRRLEGLKIRTELFDRRMEIYEAVDKWAWAWYAHGNVSEELDAAMFVAKDRSAFLFGHEVYVTLLTWIAEAAEFRKAAEGAPPVYLSPEWKQRALSVRALFAPELQFPKIE